MELYLLTGFVVLLAVIMAIIVIKLIAMVREGKPLLAIGSLAVPLPNGGRPQRAAPAPPRAREAAPPAEKASRSGLGLFKRASVAVAPPAVNEEEPAAERTRSRRILSVSEYEQAQAEPVPALPTALPATPGPDRADAVEAAIGAALDRYCDGTSDLDDFIAVLRRLDAEVQADADAFGAATLPDDLRRAQETIAWSLDWAHQEQQAS
jgi:hypothetical protein